MDYFLSVIGLVLVIEGIPYFAFPDKMKSFLEKLPLLPNSSLRAFGMGAIITGLVLIYIAKKVLG